MFTTCRDRMLLMAEIDRQNKNKKIQNQQKYSNDILGTLLMSKFNSETRFLYHLFEENPKLTFKAMQGRPEVTF